MVNICRELNVKHKCFVYNFLGLVRITFIILPFHVTYNFGGSSNETLILFLVHRYSFCFCKMCELLFYKHIRIQRLRKSIETARAISYNVYATNNRLCFSQANTLYNWNRLGISNISSLQFQMACFGMFCFRLTYVSLKGVNLNTASAVLKPFASVALPSTLLDKLLLCNFNTAQLCYV